MLHSMTSKISDPVEAATLTFKMWAALTKMADSEINVPLLRPDLAKRLLRARQARADRIAEIHLRKRLAWFDVNGSVRVIVSGMDCDCTQYARLCTLPSDFDAYCREVDSMYEWADGPMNVTIISDEAAATFVGFSRDLALEAFEDGHPHVVYA